MPASFVWVQSASGVSLSDGLSTVEHALCALLRCSNACRLVNGVVFRSLEDFDCVAVWQHVAMACTCTHRDQNMWVPCHESDILWSFDMFDDLLALPLHLAPECVHGTMICQCR